MTQSYPYAVKVTAENEWREETSQTFDTIAPNEEIAVKSILPLIRKAFPNAVIVQIGGADRVINQSVGRD